MHLYKLSFIFLFLAIGLIDPIESDIILNKDKELQNLNLQIRIPSEKEPGKFNIVNKTQKWKTDETAIVICDMWDKHWCKGASERTVEMAPHMNEIVSTARNSGIIIVHAPGGCMDFYRNHPARKNALKYKNSSWKGKVNSNKIISEKGAQWPIDDSDGGCDCEPECKQHHPWTRQIDIIQIKESDIITDSGEELLRCFETSGIKNVILMGVHTNMCIVNRPYGLRSMKNAGLNAVLMRDLTDTMYDSKQFPHVSHFEGTDLMIEYIEKFICPTILSSDFSRQKEFRFKTD